MRRFLLFALAATLFVACAKDAINEPAGIILDDNRTLTVSFEGDTEDTRIQLNEEKKSVWTEGDLLSVFYRSTTNEQWQFAGKTGDRSGNILPVDSSVVPTPTTNEIVVVYPYNAGYFYNSDTKNVQASLPAEQSYLKDSYGLDGNVMVSQSEYNQVSLKSVCGWLKLQLTGTGETVKSITLRGNAGEQVAGELYINTADATSTLASELAESGDDGEVGGTLVRPGTILTEVTLNCGEGVALGAEATAFYIALPPMTFENGFTVEIEAMDGSTMTKTTDKALAIERNYIQPMSAFAYTPTTPATPKPANNKIWYTATAKVEPYYTDEFGAKYLSNVWDSETGKGVITFEGDVTKIGYYAFYECSSLTSVTIPDSVKTIGYYAFAHCESLATVYCKPTTPPAGGGAMFYNNAAGRRIFVPASDDDSIINAYKEAWGWSGYKDYIFEDEPKPANNEIWYTATAKVEPKESTFNANIESNIWDSTTQKGIITFDADLTEVGDDAFRGSDMSSITLPKSVKWIRSYAFYECRIKSIKLFEGLKYIGDYAFKGCFLESIIIPNSVSIIEDYAFNKCYFLKSVTIGSGVTNIGYYTFSDCTNLLDVYCKPTTPPTVYNIGLSYWTTFQSNASGRKIYVPASDDDSVILAYMTAYGWYTYADDIYEYDFLEEE